MLLFLGDYLYRMVEARSAPTCGAKAVALVSSFLSLPSVIILRWEAVEQVAQLIDGIVLQKGASTSYETRAMSPAGVPKHGAGRAAMASESDRRSLPPTPRSCSLRSACSARH